MGEILSEGGGVMLVHARLTKDNLRNTVANALRHYLEQLKTCKDPDCEVCQDNARFIAKYHQLIGFSAEEVAEYKLVPWKLRGRM